MLATLSVKNKVVTTSAEAKFNASTPEADQANFDVAAEDNFAAAAGDNCNAAGNVAATLSLSKLSLPLQKLSSMLAPLKRIKCCC